MFEDQLKPFLTVRIAKRRFRKCKVLIFGWHLLKLRRTCKMWNMLNRIIHLTSVKRGIGNKDTNLEAWLHNTSSRWQSCCGNKTTSRIHGSKIPMKFNCNREKTVVFEHSFLKTIKIQQTNLQLNAYPLQNQFWSRNRLSQRPTGFDGEG